MFFKLYAMERLKKRDVVLSDVNEELINTYKVVKTNPYQLLKKLKKHSKKHSKKYYYRIRELDRRKDFKNFKDVDRAARFIYLNKTCFNGLHRTNQKGHFNVPLGNMKIKHLVDRENLLRVHRALRHVTIKHSSFEDIIKKAKKDDFIYLDPPYIPLNKTSSFTNYNKNGFNLDDQKRLRDLLLDASNRGVKLLISNSYTELTKELYKDFNIIN